MFLAEKAFPESKDWADLIAYMPRNEVFKEMKQRSMKIHLLEDAVSNHTNLDHYAVENIKMPTVNGKQLTALELLSNLCSYSSSY